jgi:DNA-binding transcriptional MerR regulator
MSRLYKVREFADLAGVTFRTLHHHDRIALLKPKRSGSGYRLYSLTDLERLVQITALKFLGISLHEIKVLLGASPLNLAESLRLQHRALKEKRDLITRAIHAIEEAERLVRPDQATDASALRKIIEVIEMQPEANFMRRYYTEEASSQKRQLRDGITPNCSKRQLCKEPSRERTGMRLRSVRADFLSLSLRQTAFWLARLSFSIEPLVRRTEKAPNTCRAARLSFVNFCRR